MVDIGKIDINRKSETNPGGRVLKRVDRRARALLSSKGIKIISGRIREWASIEDPTWQETVLDYEVEANSKTALEAWDELSDALADFQRETTVETNGSAPFSVSVNVRWK